MAVHVIKIQGPSFVGMTGHERVRKMNTRFLAALEIKAIAPDSYFILLTSYFLS